MLKQRAELKKLYKNEPKIQIVTTTAESQGKGTLLEIVKRQVDDIILPWVADGVPMYCWVPMS